MVAERRVEGRSVAMVAACPFPSHQGTQVFVRHLANGLARAGHRVHLFTYGENEPLEGVELVAGVTWYRATTPSVGLRSGPSLTRLVADGELLKLVCDVASKTKFDVLHVHNAEGLAIGAVASRITGTPLIYHAHSALGLELPLYTTSGLERALSGVIGRSFDRLAPRSAKAIICFDEAQRQRHAYLGVDQERIHVVPAGLDMDELGRERANGRHTIVYAGNPDAYQNLDLLRAAFRLFRDDQPWARLRILSNHSKEAFGALAADPGVEHARYRGPQELAKLLRVGAVGISTRTLTVGTPIKVLTYLSAGLPVVACASGARVLAAYPEAARLTEPTAAALANGIKEARGLDPTRARAELDISRHTHLYAKVYDSVLGSGVLSAKASKAEGAKKRRAHSVHRNGAIAEP